MQLPVAQFQQPGQTPMVRCPPAARCQCGWAGECLLHLWASWHCRLCFICLWALMPLAVAGEARCSAVGSCALTIAVLCLPWRLNRDRSFSCNLLLTAVTGKRGCMSGSYSRKKDYWDLMPSSSKTAGGRQQCNVILSEKVRIKCWVHWLPKQPLMLVLLL